MPEDVDWNIYEEDHRNPRSGHNHRPTHHSRRRSERSAQQLREVETMREEMKRMQQDLEDVKKQQNHSQPTQMDQHQTSQQNYPSQSHLSDGPSNGFGNLQSSNSTVPSAGLGQSVTEGLHSVTASQSQSRAPVIQNAFTKNGITLKPVSAIRKLRLYGTHWPHRLTSRFPADMYRSLFKFPVFNAVQSKCFPVVRICCLL